MIRRPPRSTQSRSSAASDVYKRQGWWAPGYRSADELWKRALESGGWWDPFYDHQDWKRVLKTESGRYEFRTDLLGGATQHLPTAALPAPAVSAQPGTAAGPLA